MPLPRLFSVPGGPDRRRAIVLLVLANTPVFVAMNTPYLRLALGAVPPAWLFLVLNACLMGQMVTLAYWFSLSRDTLWFRLSILVATVTGSILGIEFVSLYLQTEFYYRINPSDRPDVTWIEVVAQIASYYIQKTALCLALVFLAYAIFLPVRRLCGISLGTVEAEESASATRRQFEIYEWMTWTVIVAAPLVLVRIAIGMEQQQQSETMLIYGAMILFALAPLLLGWPVFRSALARRYPLPWTAATFAVLAIFGWLACEAAFWINIDRLTGSPGVMNNLFSFWPFETFILSAAAAICLNGFALRWLGFRIRRGEGAAATTASREHR